MAPRRRRRRCRPSPVRSRTSPGRCPDSSGDRLGPGLVPSAGSRSRSRRCRPCLRRRVRRASAACSRLDSPESSSVSSNSLSESESRPVLPTSSPPSLSSDAGRGGVEGQLEVHVRIAVGLVAVGACPSPCRLPFALAFLPFSSEMPLSAGSRRLMPLSPPRLPLPPPSPWASRRGRPRRSASVFSFNSKSSLSASRLSSNSLLSPRRACARLLPASDASLPVPTTSGRRAWPNCRP